MIRRLTALLLCFVCVICIMPIPQTQAAETDSDRYIQQLINYYRYYQQEAAGDIHRVLSELELEDGEKAEKWTVIMDHWRWINEQMPIHIGVLPDGLPEDDSLCIAVMGFKLESNGTMNAELISRLEAALASAQKYPNAIVVCTGGATSQRADVTEAGMMKKWLVTAGVEEHRILTETRAANTPQNAVYVYELLQREYPQITQVAIITSDYHIYRSMLLFQTEAVLKALPYHVTANAVCETQMAGEHEMEKQAKNLAELASVRLLDSVKPELQVLQTVPEQQTEPTVVQTTEKAESVQATNADERTMQEETSAQIAPDPQTEIQEIPVFAMVGFGVSVTLALILLMILMRMIRSGRK